MNDATERVDALLAEVDELLAEAGARIQHKDRPEFPPHSIRPPRYPIFGRGRVFGGSA